VTTADILNISCYKFVPLPDAQVLRDLLRERAVAAGLKGTILLAEEGINFFLAGSAEAVRGFVGALREDARFADLAPKESWSATVPFRKMLVKVKREIIRMDHPAIRPAEGRAPSVDPATLRRWLAQGHDDDGRPVVTLDTRNDFEVDHGTFDGAIDWRIRKFTDFPPALRAHKDGLPHVYQLEGGILKYFELTDGAHYHGGCFVFDDRAVLGSDLSAEGSAEVAQHTATKK
jgi:UPF0176 protein